MDCGISYIPSVMQFDHVRGSKTIALSEAASHGWSRESMAAEIEKCELVCANCHAIRTFNRTE
jgi:hypothetical protein